VIEYPSHAVSWAGLSSEVYLILFYFFLVHRPHEELWTHEEKSFNEMRLIWSVNWHGS